MNEEWIPIVMFTGMTVVFVSLFAVVAGMAEWKVMAGLVPFKSTIFNVDKSNEPPAQISGAEPFTWRLGPCRLPVTLTEVEEVQGGSTALLMTVNV